MTPDGKVLLRLRRPWRDGTRAICFEPSEFLEKLAVIIPRHPELQFIAAVQPGRSGRAAA